MFSQPFLVCFASLFDGGLACTEATQFDGGLDQIVIHSWFHSSTSVSSPYQNGFSLLMVVLLLFVRCERIQQIAFGEHEMRLGAGH